MDSTSCRKTCKRFSKIAYLTNQNLDLSDTKEKDTEDATTSLGYLWLDRRPKTFQRTNLMNTSCSDHNLFELDICNKQVLKIPTCYTAHDTSLKKTKQKKPTVQSKLSKTKWTHITNEIIVELLCTNLLWCGVRGICKSITLKLKTEKLMSWGPFRDRRLTDKCNSTHTEKSYWGENSHTHRWEGCGWNSTEGLSAMWVLMWFLKELHWV